MMSTTADVCLSHKQPSKATINWIKPVQEIHIYWEIKTQKSEHLDSILKKDEHYVRKAEPVRC